MHRNGSSYNCFRRQSHCQGFLQRRVVLNGEVFLQVVVTLRKSGHLQDLKGNTFLDDRPVKTENRDKN